MFSIRARAFSKAKDFRRRLEFCDKLDRMRFPPVAPLFCLVFLAYSQSAFASGKQGFFLQQRSNFLGQREVYLTDSGFMAINHVSGHILITKAPDWNVRVANLKSRLYFITPFDTWMGRKVAMGEKAMRGLTTQKPSAVPGRSKEICGLKAVKFKLDSAEGLEKRFINGRRDMNDFDKAAYWVTTDLPFPQPARNTILTFFQLPQLPAFPLEVSYYRGKHDSKIPHLLTTEVRKQIIDDSVFELPKNCKKARFEAEVWVDEKTRDLFEMFQ